MKVLKKVLKRIEEDKEVCLGKLIHEFVAEHDFKMDRCMNFGDIFILGLTEDTMEVFGELINRYGLKMYKKDNNFFITVGGKRGQLEVLRVSDDVIKEKRKQCSNCEYQSKCKPTVIVAETKAGVIELFSYNLSLQPQKTRKGSNYIY